MILFLLNRVISLEAPQNPKNNSMVSLKKYLPHLIAGATLIPLLTFADEAKYTLMSELPGIDTTTDLSGYTKGIVQILIGITGVLAVVRMVRCGIELMATASPSAKNTAKSCIVEAILGLLLALGSWAILNTISAKLVSVTDLSSLEVLNLNTEGKTPDQNPNQVQGDVGAKEGWRIKYKTQNGSTAFMDAPTYDDCIKLLDNLKATGVNTDGKSQITILPDESCKEKRAQGAYNTGNLQINTDGTVGSGGSEQQFRDQLTDGHVTINNGPCRSIKVDQRGCTSLEGIDGSIVSAVVQLKQECTKNDTACGIILTGGSEAGHRSHGAGIPIVDLAQTKTLTDYILKNIPQGKEKGAPEPSFDGYQKFGVKIGGKLYWFTKEGTYGAKGAHYHVCPDGYNDTVGCSSKKKDSTGG